MEELIALSMPDSKVWGNPSEEAVNIPHNVAPANSIPANRLMQRDYSLDESVTLPHSGAALPTVVGSRHGGMTWSSAIHLPVDLRNYAHMSASVRIYKTFRDGMTTAGGSSDWYYRYNYAGKFLAMGISINDTNALTTDHNTSSSHAVSWNDNAGAYGLYQAQTGEAFPEELNTTLTNMPLLRNRQLGYEMSFKKQPSSTSLGNRYRDASEFSARNNVSSSSVAHNDYAPERTLTLAIRYRSMAIYDIHVLLTKFDGTQEQYTSDDFKDIVTEFPNGTNMRTLLSTPINYRHKQIGADTFASDRYIKDITQATEADWAESRATPPNPIWLEQYLKLSHKVDAVALAERIQLLEAENCALKLAKLRQQLLINGSGFEAAGYVADAATYLK